MNRRHLYGLVVILTFISLGMMFYKVLALDFPLKPQAARPAWQFETRVRFNATGKPVKVRVHIPTSGQSFQLSDEQFFSGGYGLTTSKAKESGERSAIWSIRSAKGRQTLFYRASIQHSPKPLEKTAVTPPVVTTPNFSEAELATAMTILERARTQSADIDTLVIQLLKFSQQAEAELLFEKSARPRDRLATLVSVLALENIPARVANGLELVAPQSGVKPGAWLEVFDDNQWSLFEEGIAEKRSAEDILILWRGLEPMVEVEGGSNLETDLALTYSQLPATESLLTNDSQRHWVVDYSLINLPPSTQSVYRILLTLPIGALILVLLRNVVGVKTFGTFMPVLMALAFRETQLLAGIILFTLIVALGLSIRFYLEHLKLLLVPRLASILIVVLLIMTGLSVLSYKLEIAVGLSVSLFPMVVLTMIIERMSIVWEERGPAEAIKQGLGSLFVATVAYLAMNIELVEHLIFMFPEILLVILAVTLLLGRYSGYRLLELRRFRVLARDAA